MIRAAAAALAFVLCAQDGASAATRAQVDRWLATSKAIAHLSPPSGTVASMQHRPYVSVRGVLGATGWIDPGDVTDGYLADGAQRVMMLPIESGGSGDVFTALLFTQVDGRVRFVGTLPSAGGHLDAYLDGGRIVVRTPVYAASDPNCCPSAQHYRRATLHGTTLVTEDEWDVPLAKPR